MKLYCSAILGIIIMLSVHALVFMYNTCMVVSIIPYNGKCRRVAKWPRNGYFLLNGEFKIWRIVAWKSNHAHRAREHGEHVCTLISHLY